jgi:hypothetical protein
VLGRNGSPGVVLVWNLPIGQEGADSCRDVAARAQAIGSPGVVPEIGWIATTWAGTGVAAPIDFRPADVDEFSQIQLERCLAGRSADAIRSSRNRGIG